MKLFHLQRALLCSASGLALAISATTVAAQDSVPEIDFDDEGYLGILLLGNNKREVQVDTATPITVINAEEIQDRQASSIAELIDSVPGVTLVNSGTPSGAGINIRGYGADGTYGSNQKVQIQLDGASMGSEELYRIGTQLYTDPALFKEVSVIRGTVGSYEYGSGIIGGVVNLETIDASDLTEGELGLSGRQTVEYYSNGNAKVSSTILAYQPTEKLEFVLNYTHREQDDYEDGNGDTVLNTRSKAPSYLAKMKYSFGDNSNQSLTFAHSRTVSDEKDVPYDAFSGFAAFGNVDRKVDTKTTTLEYAYTPVGNDLIDLTATLSYAEQSIDQEAVIPPGFAVVNADHDYTTTKLTVKNTSLFTTSGLSHNLRTGVEISRRERATANSAPGGTDDRIAIFAIDELDFGNGFTLTPAMRFETQDVTSNSTGTYVTNGESFSNSERMGGISARYAFDNGWAVFGSAAYTAGLPILDDFDYAEYKTLMTQSEKAVTYELGASYDRVGMFGSDDTFRAKVNLWSTRLWDYTSSGTSFQQVDRLETEGVEIEASYSHGSGFYADMNANITSGEWSEFLTPGRLSRRFYDRVPANGIGLTVGKKFNEKLDVSWETKLAEDFHGVAGYGVNNLRGTYKIETGLLKSAELRVGIENIFDKQYQPHLSQRPAAGRNIKVSLAAAF